MHGMLSAAVMLAAFAVTALAGVVSVVWLYRVEAAGPRRSRAPRPAGTVTAAAPGDPGAMAAAGLAGGAARPDELAGPDELAPGTMAAAGASGAAQDTAAAGQPILGWDDVYDGLGWPVPGGERGAGGGLDAISSRRWPDARRSLYSRGWPAMDSSPRTERAPRAPDPDGREPVPQDAAPAAGPAEARPASTEGAEGAEGARVYVLGEARRRER